ncbi:hypothetical protein GCM10010116_27590 [Microbispora rosea subsp. aerata]|nr:hypothetical protein GCM10010116_27590 [Microbispora rosea subsp. aerata]GIH53966.1 hypothetical protein Mro02_08800 [Microbispora rosea subsp. aerata]GLJ84939.1 hypothetical protein GCM10017588_36670 [Microbispora rosea subsp. aerata]
MVGTYRLLPPRRSDRLYSDAEFNLGALGGLRGDLVEAGRTCVHPDHRGGAVVALMWAGIAHYMTSRGHTWLAGCCSVPLADGGMVAAGVVDRVPLGPEEHRVTPHTPWRDAVVPRSDRFVLPPLLRGYLRLGAWVCGAPAHDPDFDTADFFVLLSAADADPRYLRQVGGWPIVGTLAACGSVLFIDRDRLSTLPGVVEDLAAALRSGESVGGVPRGHDMVRTRDGPFPARGVPGRARRRGARAAGGVAVRGGRGGTCRSLHPAVVRR